MTINSVGIDFHQGHALQRLTRQRKRLESDIAGRKVRIEAIIDGYLPGIRKAFASPWSTQVRVLLRARLNPFAVVRDGEKALSTFLSKAASRDKGIRAESHQIFQACQSVADICKVAEPATTINEEFFEDGAFSVGRYRSPVGPTDGCRLL